MTFEKNNKFGVRPTDLASSKWETARKLQSEGLTGKEIAKQIGVSPGRVSQVLGKRRTKSEEPQA